MLFESFVTKARIEFYKRIQAGIETQKKYFLKFVKVKSKKSRNRNFSQKFSFGQAKYLLTANGEVFCNLQSLLSSM